MAYRYAFHGSINRAFLGEFLVKDVTFNSPLKGAGGQFAGTIVLDDKRQTADLVKPATELETSAVYVIYQDDETGVETYLWGGPIVRRGWNSRTREVKITAVEWKSWFYTKEYSPSITPPFADRKFLATAVDQLTIARNLIVDAVSFLGTPAVVVPIVASTRTRSLTVFGSEHRKIGDLVDSMANRTDGFDWDVMPRKAYDDGLPELVVNFYYPEKGSVQGLEFSQVRNTFDRAADGRGTIMDIPEWVESSDNRRTRIWAVGNGQPPDQPVAMDDDPFIDTEEVLLREDTLTVQADNPATLSEHAQAQRAVLGVETESIDIGIKANLIKPTAFAVGDRVSLRVKDEWLLIDQDAVRIVDRAVAPYASGEGERIVVTLDLSDLVPADLDEG